MNKNDVEVIINNKRYVLCGYESDEYLQKVATYLNGKYAEFKVQENFNKLEPEMKNILMQINVADDYFKAQKQVSDLEEDAQRKDNEIFDMKHEVIAYQTKMEALQKQIERLEADSIETQKKIVRLETELEERSKTK